MNSKPPIADGDIDLAESVAGEEDPGSSIEIAPAPAASRRTLQTRAGLLECEVSGTGAPAIVLFNGAGMTIDSWKPLAAGLAGLGTVFAWNRFGTEASDAPRQAQTGAVVIASLRELMKYAGVQGPFVLVAHSFGALYANLFARLHPADVAGVLLVEPVDVQKVDALEPRQDEFIRSLSKVQGVAPERFEANLRAELAAVDDLVEEVRNAGAFPDVPVSQVAGQGQSHFPQIDDPAAVLAEFRDLLVVVAAGQTRT